MPSLDQIAGQMVNTLALSDPELDTSIGTPARKIIDAVAFSISNAYVDNHITSYQYDIDGKAGADLDAFVQLFGLARLPGKRASGVVTFTRNGSIDLDLFIPATTEVASIDGADRIRTLMTIALPAGQTSIAVPVQAIDAGVEGNAAAGVLTQIITPLTNITIANNALPLTGGTSPENDEELRARWKSTVFRSLAGTEQMYRGIALDDESCTSVSVIGSSKRHREHLQILSGAATSQIQAAKYIYGSNVLVGLNLDDAAEDLYTGGTDYTWNATVNPPTITSIDGSIPEGAIVDVDFEYVPTSSRNDPASGVANKVDVWLAGSRAAMAVQTLFWQNGTGSMITFNNTSTSPYYRLNFIGLDGTAPTNGNVFIPLNYGPIISVPSVITWGGETWGLKGSGVSATHTNAYRIVHDDTVNGYTSNSLFGLEWLSGSVPTTYQVATISSASLTSNIATITTAVAHNLSVGDTAVVDCSDNSYDKSAAPVLSVPTPTTFTYAVTHGNLGSATKTGTVKKKFPIATSFGDNDDYLYNEVPASIVTNLDRWRLVGTDVKVHQGRELLLRFSLAIMYDGLLSIDATNLAIDDAISKHLTLLGIGGIIQASDILQIVHNVTGVDAVRFIDGSDIAGYDYASRNNYAIGIQRILPDGTGTVAQTYINSGTSGRCKDVLLNDSQYASLESINKSIKAQNTFGG